MDLGGRWRAIEANEEVRRLYPEPSFDDAGWAEIGVPGHWRSTPEFASSDGPLLMRRRFEAPASVQGVRQWLTFEGLMYQSDVWLDGAYLGDTEGYFFPHTFEITEQLRERSEHVLAVEATCAPQRDRKAKRNLTGVFQHSDAFDPDWNPGGIWRPVNVSQTGPIRIARLRVQCPEANPDRAVLSFRAILDAADAGGAELQILIGDSDRHVHEQTLAAGENRVEWKVELENPTLWWPHALGAANLVDVTVEVRLLDRAEPSDRRVVTTGIRQIRLDDWIASVNGERLFLKGTNQGPTRMALADATRDELEGDVARAKEVGLDLIRLHAHVSRPELYEAADREGMLLWQDLPLQWGYARGIRKQAVRQAREAVDLLSHHPSIALWCAHNEPLTFDAEPGGAIDVPSVARAAVRDIALPSWNKTVLDGSLRRALEKADPSRPAIAQSGMPTGDSHLYFGWYHGTERDLARSLASWPRLGRFVSEFGAQAVPVADAFMEPDRWPDLDWERLGRHHALQRGVFVRNGLDPADYETFDAWRDATQTYQATLVRRQIETIRRLKYRPSGGFAQFCFADGHPGVTWSVLDHERNPKRGYEALAAACGPVIIVADRPEATYLPGAQVSLDIHVVSDRREPIEDATVTAAVVFDGGEERRSWAGSISADSCVRIGTLEFIAPSTQGGVVIEVELVCDQAKATNRYETYIQDA